MHVTDLTGTKIYRLDNGEEAGRCVDLLLDVARAELAYALVDFGLGGAHHATLVSRNRLSIREGQLRVDITDAELSAQHDKAVDEGPVNLSAMPPVVVGPFGYTVAPALAGALFNSGAKAEAAKRPSIDATHRNWHWFARIRGLPVFSETGELGTLKEIVLNPDNLTCAAIYLDTTDADAPSFLPFEKVRMVSKTEESIILDMADPPLHTPRAQDPHH